METTKIERDIKEIQSELKKINKFLENKPFQNIENYLIEIGRLMQTQNRTLLNFYNDFVVSKTKEWVKENDP